jgi:hypothetical protein
MDNMGGLRKLYYIDAEDFISLEEGENDLFELTLENGAVLSEIAFTEETGKISESEEDGDNGIVYNFETSCRIPKCGPDNTDLLGALRQKKILILAQDNNENFWLSGAPGTYFNINVNSDAGQAIQDPNARHLKISAALMEGSVFIESPLN